MFQEPLGIVAVLLLIEALVLGLAELRPLQKFFDFVPTMFWIYFLPILANTAGIIPGSSPAYDAIGANLLPGTLVLLLLSVDVRAILRLGWYALATMLVGSAGIVVGAVAVLVMFRPWLPPDIAKGLGALSASWTGGSANMIAVKNATNTPNSIFLLMVVVDSIVPYVWMSVLMAMAALQGRYDTWNKSNPAVIEKLTRHSSHELASSRALTLPTFVLILCVAGVGSLAARQLGGMLPEVPDTISRGAWTLILATAIGVALSFTPARRLESFGASRIGYGLLYFVLTSYGAQANLGELSAAPLLIGVGVVWVIIHGLFTVAAGRLLRAPLALLATASQANVGGVASTPVVAGKYHPKMVGVGLMLAIFGNIIGTGVGLLCSKLCQWIAGWQ